VPFVACAAACLFAFAVVRAVRNPAPTEVFKTPPATIRPQELIREYKPAKYERVVYPYSVIPGGVHSREELAANISSDRVVAAHFADFMVSQARIAKAEETKFVHVSYRIGDKVFWTAKTVKLPKGETLITDGRDVARTRCGNKVSAVPQEPVFEEEPAIETFDVPVIAKLETPELETIVESGLEPRDFSPLEPVIPIQRPNILPYYYRPLFVIRPPDMVVPEPGTLSLLIVGLTGFLLVRFIRKK